MLTEMELAALNAEGLEPLTQRNFCFEFHLRLLPFLSQQDLPLRLPSSASPVLSSDWFFPRGCYMFFQKAKLSDHVAESGQRDDDEGIDCEHQ